MTSRIGLLAALLGACSFGGAGTSDTSDDVPDDMSDDVVDDVPDDDVVDDVPDDDQVELDAAPDTSVMPSDRDQDGVDDSADNCPDAQNGTQRDHDDDGRGDVCDGCPHVRDGGADQDGDGVGDACDPRVASGGDELLKFWGFYDESELTTDFFATAGSPSFSAGFVDLVGTEGISPLGAFAMPPELLTMTAGIRIDSIATNEAFLGVAAGFKQSPETIYLCALVRQGSLTTAAAAGEWSPVNGDNNPEDIDTDPWLVGATNVNATITIDLVRGRSRCLFKGASTTQDTAIELSTNTNTGSVAGQVAIQTEGGDVAIDYLVLIRRGGQ